MIMTSVLLVLMKMIGYILIAVSLFRGRKDMLVVIGFGLLTVQSFGSFIRGFSTGLYTIYSYSYSYSYSYGYGSHTNASFSFLCMLPALIMFAACLMMFLICGAFCTDSFRKYEEKAKKLWFLPAVLSAAVIVFALLAWTITRLRGASWNGSLAYLSGSNLFWQILFIVGVLLTGMWLASITSSSQAKASVSVIGEGTGASSSAAPSGGYAMAAQPQPQDGYCDMVKHILLLLFTFGIWYLIWIYRATGYLNRVREEEPRNPTTKLLLCMFVPFYSIYWTYKSAQRLDRLAASRGVPSDLTTLCLVLAIFVPIIPPMLMQDKMNAVVVAENGGVNRQNDYAQQPFSNTAASAGAASNAYAAPAGGASNASAASAGRASSASARTNTASPRLNLSAAEELKAYKELLDCGALTQEEFDAMKRSILKMPSAEGDGNSGSGDDNVPFDPDELPDL